MKISQHGAKRSVANVLAKLNCTHRSLAVAVSVSLQEDLLDDVASAVPASIAR